MDGATLNTWLIAAAAALVLGGIAHAWILRVRRKQLEASAGLSALASMRWREFSHFVLDVMKHRGFDVVPMTSDDDTTDLQSEIFLRRDDQRWLLSCRHGATPKVTADHVDNLIEASLGNRGGGKGILVTTGRITSAARSAARNKIELLSGSRLWKEISPFLPEALLLDVQATADTQTRRVIGFNWLAAAAAGVLVLLLVRQYPGWLQPESGQAAPEPALVDNPQPRATQLAATLQAPPVVATNAAPDTQPSGQTMPGRREIAQAVSGLPGIDRAIWISQSTLLVHLDDVAAGNRLDAICDILMENETLTASRLQLQSPPGSDQPVAFRQCRAY